MQNHSSTKEEILLRPVTTSRIFFIDHGYYFYSETSRFNSLVFHQKFSLNIQTLDSYDFYSVRVNTIHHHIHIIVTWI